MTPDLQSSLKSFKQRKTFATRKEEVAGIRAKFPTKIPVVVERYGKETRLGKLDKMKFLVPQELSMCQFVTIIRNRLQLNSTCAFYLIVGNKSISSVSKTMGEIYKDYSDADGFLYLTYASQEMFGAGSTSDNDEQTSIRTFRLCSSDHCGVGSGKSTSDISLEGSCQHITFKASQPLDESFRSILPS